MMGIPFSSLADGVLLVALGLGYIVCYLAHREEKPLQMLGVFIGVTMIVLSIMLLTNNLILNLKISQKLDSMPFGRIMQRPMPPAPPR